MFIFYSIVYALMLTGWLFAVLWLIKLFLIGPIAYLHTESDELVGFFKNIKRFFYYMNNVHALTPLNLVDEKMGQDWEK